MLLWRFDTIAMESWLLTMSMFDTSQTAPNEMDGLQKAILPHTGSGKSQTNRLALVTTCEGSSCHLIVQKQMPLPDGTHPYEKAMC